MSYCLIPKLADEFKQRLTNGEIDPFELAKATSEERRQFFAEFLGETNAKNVNALFESKLLLKNQQAGFITWAKSVTGIKPEVRRDIISRIERLDKVLNPSEEKAFLSDLAAKRLGFDVSFEEAQHITEGLKQLKTLEAKIPQDAPIRSQERLDYGLQKALFQEYIKDLKTQSTTPTFKEWITSPKLILRDVASTTKSVLASLDNSFFGRQGLKMLFSIRNADIWMKSFIKSWGDIAKELAGRDAMIPIRADVYSRPNALNGKYKAGGYALDILSEEAFPTSLPEKIPLFGRLFKASESAYNGAALRMRADYADRIIKRAEKGGIDTLDPQQAVSLGKLVNSMTGRGSLGRLEPMAQDINAAFFSIKYLKANFDVLTAHALDTKMSGFAKRQAALNLLGIVTTTAAVLYTAKQFWPDSVDSDPHGTNLGKIKIGKTTYDVTGGMAGLVTLSARLLPTEHNGQWGWWTKNSKGQVVSLHSGQYGASTALDVFDNFWQGKLSPLAGLIRDVWQGTDYNNQEVTPKTAAKNALYPLPVQTYLDLKNADSADTLATMILEELGINTYTPPPKKSKQ